MEKNERAELRADEPRRPWKKPVLHEEDYSVTETSFVATGSDFGIYS